MTRLPGAVELIGEYHSFDDLSFGSKLMLHYYFFRNITFLWMNYLKFKKHVN